MSREDRHPLRPVGAGTATLLRRVQHCRDEAWHDGRWHPTKVIVEYMFGRPDGFWVDYITEAGPGRWNLLRSVAGVGLARARAGERCRCCVPDCAS